MSRFIESSGTTAHWNLIMRISCIISKWYTHIGLNSSGNTSSHSRHFFTVVYKSNHIVAVIDVIFPVRPNIILKHSAFFVMLAGMINCCCDDFFLLHFVAKSNPLMSSNSKSPLVSHASYIDAYFIIWKCCWWIYSTKPNLFIQNPPLFNTNSICSAIFIAYFKFCAPDKQSSAYISFCTMWLTWGNSIADIRAVSRSPFSDWFPLYFTPYINLQFAWSLSLQVSFCCKVQFAIYTSERTNVLLAVEQFCTLFWHLCGNQFYELTSGSRFQPICSCYSFPLLRWHWSLYQKQLVETHQMQDCMICLMSCYSKLLSKGSRSGLNSLPAFFVVLMLSF